jgi:hypothetical protein
MVYINAEGVGTSFTCALSFFVKKTIEISSRTCLASTGFRCGRVGVEMTFFSFDGLEYNKKGLPASPFRTDD